MDNTTGKTLVTSNPQNSLPAVQLNPQPELPHPPPPLDIFGQMGIVSGQTIRLNAVNALNPDATSYPPSPCRATLEVFDDDTGRTTAIQLPAVQLLAVQLPQIFRRLERAAGPGFSDR